MTHAELVKAACRWLRSYKKCKPVFADFRHQYSDEIPDAIGWTRTLTHVVECKVTRSDFRADAKKRHVVNGDSIGHRRWYLTPSGLLRSLGELPEGYGLLTSKTGKRIRIHTLAQPRTPSAKAAREEIDILRQAVIRHAMGVEWKPAEFRFKTKAEAKADEYAIALKERRAAGFDE